MKVMVTDASPRWLLSFSSPQTAEEIRHPALPLGARTWQENRLRPHSPNYRNQITCGCNNTPYPHVDLSNRTPHITLDSRTRGENIERRERQRKRGTVELMERRKENPRSGQHRKGMWRVDRKKLSLCGLHDPPIPTLQTKGPVQGVEIRKARGQISGPIQPPVPGRT